MGQTLAQRAAKENKAKWDEFEWYMNGIWTPETTGNVGQLNHPDYRMYARGDETVWFAIHKKLRDDIIQAIEDRVDLTHDGYRDYS